MSAGALLVPDLPDMYPLLIVAVAYAGISAGVAGVVASMASVTLQAVVMPNTVLEIVVRLTSAAAIGVMCATVRERYVRERWALRALNDQLRGFATRDALTGLVNRRGFDEALEAATALAARRGDQFALISADIDGLKKVNDTRGHPGGDAVIECFAHALRGHLRTGDVAARVGGDEFSIIVMDVDERAAREVIGRVMKTYDELSSRRNARAAVSFGIARYPADAQTTDDLVAAADRALYAQKHRQANCS